MNASEAVQFSNSTTPSVQTRGNSTLGKDDFLKLLIQQLKFQDPLNPLKGTEFASQLAQFGSVEQLTNINSSLKQSLDASYIMSQSINNTMSATLIGKEVKATGNTVHYDGSNDVSLGYTLAERASTVKVSVYNEKNELVTEFATSKTDKGDNDITWDGTDKFGNRLPTGKYSFKIEAKDADGKVVGTAPQTYVWGTISSVRYTQQGTVLMMNGIEINLSDVLEIGGKRG
mgnify:CR=1 FL=1